MSTSLSFKAQVVFIITGIIVGLLVTTQFRNAIPGSSYPYDELQQQKELLKSYNDDQNVFKSKIVTLRKKIEDKQLQASQLIEKNNLDILSQLKKELGLETANGPGVEITMNDGIFVKNTNAQEIDQSLVQAADLRDLVNLLFSAQTQAIAINNQRVIASTPITSVGNTILVNNYHLLPPFTITAIGDSDRILQLLNDPNILPDLQKRIKTQKIKFSLINQKNLRVPIYNGDFQLKYIREFTSL